MRAFSRHAWAGAILLLLPALDTVQGKAYNINEKPVSNHFFGLLFKSSYTVKSDGTVWEPNALEPVPESEMPFVLDKIIRRQRFEALLTLNLILSRSQGEKNLSDEEKRSIRRVVSENWSVFAYGTRKDFRDYFTREEFEGMNATMPLPPQPPLVDLPDDLDIPSRHRTDSPRAASPPKQAPPKPAALPSSTVTAVSDVRETAVPQAVDSPLSPTKPASARTPDAGVPALPASAPTSDPHPPAPPAREWVAPQMVRVRMDAPVQYPPSAADSPAPAPIRTAPEPSSVSRRRQPVPTLPENVSEPSPPAQTPSVPAPSVLERPQKLSSPPQPIQARTQRRLMETPSPAGNVPAVPAVMVPLSVRRAAQPPAQEPADSFRVLVEPPSKPADIPAAPPEKAVKPSQATPAPAPHPLQERPTAPPPRQERPAPAKVVPPAAKTPEPAQPGSEMTGSTSGLPSGLDPRMLQQLLHRPETKEVTAPPQPEPKPEPEPFKDHQQSDAPTALLKDIEPATFQEFLDSAPYSRPVRSILKVISDNAPAFARRRVLNLITTLVPHIAVDPARTGRHLRAGFEDAAAGQPPAVILAPSAVLFERKGFFFTHSSALVSQSGGAYHRIGLPVPGLKAMSLESVPSKKETSEWGETLLFEDGSRRVSFSREQQAGTLLASLLELDLRLRGQDASPYTAFLYTRTAQMMLYSRLERELGGDDFLDPALRASYRQWLTDPRAFRDHALQSLSAGMTGSIDPGRAGPHQAALSGRAILEDCPAHAARETAQEAVQKRKSREWQAGGLLSAGLIDKTRLEESLAYIKRTSTDSGSAEQAASWCAALATTVSQLRQAPALLEELLKAELAHRLERSRYE